MQEVIQKYFAVHQQLSLANVGTFVVKMNPARKDIIDKLIYPPTPFIGFAPNFDNDTAPLLYYISREKEIDEDAAAKALKDFEKNISDALAKGQEVTLDGIGILEKKGERISFKASPIENFFEPVPAERIIRPNARHQVTVGEKEILSGDVKDTVFNNDIQNAAGRWWIGALILAAIGIAAIAFYHFR